MKKYKAIYQSMIAYYELGYYYANSEEEATREARARASAFSSNEKGLIRAFEVNN